MDKDKVLKVFKNIFLDHIHYVDQINMDATIDSLGIDALDAVEIVLALEDEFNVHIDDSEVEHSYSMTLSVLFSMY